MTPTRTRQIRLVAALLAAVLLAVALIYTSFTAANDSVEPSEMARKEPGVTANVTGKVVKDHQGEPRRFEIVDQDGGGEPMTVVYEGAVPDPFRAGREIIVTGALDEKGVLVGERDTLITKCPSKFQEEYGDDPNIEYED
jgi:cytochrome c-type biogenesis protein CcmE